MNTMKLKELLELANLDLSIHVENNKGQTLIEDIQIDTYFACDCYRFFDAMQVGYIDTYADYETGLQVIYISQK